MAELAEGLSVPVDCGTFLRWRDQGQPGSYVPMEQMKLPAQPNESLMNGMRLLQLVVGVGEPIGSREAARRMGLDHSRVNRLLGTLAFLGMLQRDSSRKYRPGPALHVLAAQSMMASRLLPSALPVLMRLREGGFTVALGVLWEGRVCYLFHERPWQPLEQALFRHVLWPAQHSSVGLALLAAQAGEPALVEPDPGLHISVLPGQPVDELLRFARDRGYALLKHEGNHVSIGVTVGSPAVAGLAVAGNHIGESYYEGIAAQLKAAAAEIVQRMEDDLPSESMGPRESSGVP